MPCCGSRKGRKSSSTDARPQSRETIPDSHTTYDNSHTEYGSTNTYTVQDPEKRGLVWGTTTQSGAPALEISFATPAFPESALSSQSSCSGRMNLASLGRDSWLSWGGVKDKWSPAIRSPTLAPATSEGLFRASSYTGKRHGGKKPIPVSLQLRNSTDSLETQESRATSSVNQHGYDSSRRPLISTAARKRSAPDYTSTFPRPPQRPIEVGLESARPTSIPESEAPDFIPSIRSPPAAALPHSYPHQAQLEPRRRAKSTPNRQNQPQPSVLSLVSEEQHESIPPVPVTRFRSVSITQPPPTPPPDAPLPLPPIPTLNSLEVPHTLSPSYGVPLKKQSYRPMTPLAVPSSPETSGHFGTSTTPHWTKLHGTHRATCTTWKLIQRARDGGILGRHSRGRGLGRGYDVNEYVRSGRRRPGTADTAMTGAFGVMGRRPGTADTDRLDGRW